MNKLELIQNEVLRTIMAFQKADEAQILDWVKKRKVDFFGKYLVSGTVHGKPGLPLSELTRIEKILVKNLRDTDRYELAKVLLQRTEYTARNIGLHFITAGWPLHKEVENLVKIAADDHEWIVREFAAGAFARLLDADFNYFSKQFQRWIQTESVNVKRAIALAVKYDSKSLDPKKLKTYLKLVEPLMSEEAEYVRINLGPFAIGDGLLNRFPNQILDSCTTWSKSKNENVKWNTAMVFTAAAARKFAKPATPILKKLLKDESKFVGSAAKKAVKNLGLRL